MLESYNYDYESDPKYCYPENGVLKNKLGIKDEAALKTAEREITAMWLLRLKEEPIKGKFDLAHLKRIHRRMFSDIYPWAGSCRSVDISKGNVFCRAMFIETYAAELFGKLAEENMLVTADPDTVPDRLAYYLSEINVLHPFREGNGRTQRLFIEYLGSVSGVHVDFSDVTPEEMVHASADAFATDYRKLNAMFRRICTPLPHEKQAQSIAFFLGSRSPQMALWKSIH